jgi:hypothetical protein
MKAKRINSRIAKDNGFDDRIQITKLWCRTLQRNLRKMKTTILLFAVIFGCIAPAYSQLNRHRKAGTTSELFENKTSEQFRNKKNYDFGHYKFDKLSGRLSYEKSYSLDILSTSPPAPNKAPAEIYSKYKMPCFHPKSGDEMPWCKPTGTFHMRIFNPNDVNWGILY